MSRLPFVRQLFKFGRKISKMALKIKSTNYNTLSNQKNSNYFPAFFDTEIDNNLAGSYSSSGYISPKLSEASSNNEDFSKFEIKRGKETDLSSIFDSFNLYETSTVLPKDWQIPKNSIDWEQSINALFDPSLKQFTAFENFVQSSSNGFSDCSLFSYSPLSSLESISNDQHCKFQVPNQVDVQEEEHAQNNDNDLYSNDFSYRMQQECIRREFEMNGKNVDEPEVDENFHPLAMSTPFVERKSDQYKLNYSKNNETTKVQTQFSPPKHHQLSAMSVPFHPSNSNKENFNKMQFDSIYPPPYLIPSIPHDHKAEKKIHGRKRGHHQLIQSHVTLQNQLPMINTNNPNRQQFGAGNEKKLDNKKSSSKKKKLDDHCVFCKNNGADEILYKSHTVKDLKGRVLCPKLRAYQCPICGADGDQSHTVKYCPKKPIVTMDDLKKMEASKKTNGHASHRF